MPYTPGDSIISFYEYIVGYLFEFLFPMQHFQLSSGTFWLYGAVCLAGTLYTIFLVPETKGKTIEEIQQMFSPSPDEKKKRGSVA